MNINTINNNHKEIIYLNRIRIFASLLVIVIHASGYFFYSFSTNSFAWITSTLFNSMSRIAVPLFVFVSGAIYLNEEKIISPKKHLFNIIRFISIFFIWDFIYLCIDYKIFTHISNINKVFKNLENYSQHLWYLLDYIMLLAFVPILRLFCKKENKKHIEYLLFLFLIFSTILSMLSYIINLFNPNIILVNILQSILSILDLINIWKKCDLIILFISGWYFSTFDFKEKIKTISLAKWILGISIPIITIILCIITNKDGFSFISNIYFLPNYLLTICVFLTFRYSKHTHHTNNFLDCLSKNSFGIYLCHVLFLNNVYKFINNYFSIYFNSLWLLLIIPVFVIITYILSLLFSILINLLPSKIKKWIC